MARYVVVYDTCVLFPNTQRDLLIRLSIKELVQAKWSSEILDELRTTLKSRRDMSDEQLDNLVDLMNQAVPDCMVDDYAGMATDVKLPDERDRHVVAAAIRSRAQAIVTDNIKDFPAEELGRYGISVFTPDEFVLNQISIDDRTAYACLQQIADSRVNPTMGIDDVMHELENSGLLLSMAKLRSA